MAFINVSPGPLHCCFWMCYLKFCVLSMANLEVSIIRTSSDYCTTLVSVAACRADYQVIWHERERHIWWIWDACLMFVLDLTRKSILDKKSVVFPGQIHSVCDPLIIERVWQIEFFYSNHTLFTVNFLKISRDEDFERDKIRRLFGRLFQAPVKFWNLQSHAYYLATLSVSRHGKCWYKLNEIVGPGTYL